MTGNRLFNFFKANLAQVVNSRHFGTIVTRMVFGWSTQDQLNLVRAQRRESSSKEEEKGLQKKEEKIFRKGRGRSLKKS